MAHESVNVVVSSDVLTGIERDKGQWTARSSRGSYRAKTRLIILHLLLKDLTFYICRTFHMAPFAVVLSDTHAPVSHALNTKYYPFN